MFAAALLTVQISAWVMFPGIGREWSDIAWPYSSAQLVVHGKDPYDVAAEQRQYDLDVHYKHRAVLATNWLPPAILLAVPFTALPLENAAVVWSVAQGTLLVLATLVAVRGSPRRPSSAPMAAATVALGGAGVYHLLVQSQISAVPALAVGAAAALAPRQRTFLLGMAIGAAAILSKPQLLIGVGIFLLSARLVRIVGVIVGATLVSLPATAVLGPASWVQWVRVVLSVRYHLQSMYSAWSYPGHFLGDGIAAYAVGSVLGLTCLTGCALIGVRARRGVVALPDALLAATCLSLLAAPHLFGPDILVVAPAVAATLATRNVHDRMSARLKGAWLILGTLLCFYIVWYSMPGAPDFLTTSQTLGTPLLLLAVCAIVTLQRSPAAGSRMAIDP